LKAESTEQLDEVTLISHVLAGRLDYFELLMRRNNPYLYRIGRSYGFRHEDIEDLMQEAHISAYFSLAKFEGRASYKTWLSRIMMNQCYQRIQKKSFSNERTTMDTLNTDAFPAQSTNDTEHMINRKDLSRIVESVLEKIPVEFREVIVLKDLNEMSITDTAHLLQLSEANVKVRLHRGRKLMREKIEEIYRPEDIFEFNLVHCDTIVKRVMERIGQLVN
jgi:RNA polymerase sigma-70 factor (ECF subfamily)